MKYWWLALLVGAIVLWETSDKDDNSAREKAVMHLCDVNDAAMRAMFQETPSNDKELLNFYQRTCYENAQSKDILEIERDTVVSLIGLCEFNQSHEFCVEFDYRAVPKAVYDDLFCEIVAREHGRRMIGTSIDGFGLDFDDPVISESYSEFKSSMKETCKEAAKDYSLSHVRNRYCEKTSLDPIICKN